MKKISFWFIFQFLIGIAFGQSFTNVVSKKFSRFNKDIMAEEKLFFNEYNKRNPAQNINSAFIRIDRYDIIALKFYETIRQLRDQNQDLTLQEYEFVDSIFKAMLDVQKAKHNAIELAFKNQELKNDIKVITQESFDFLSDKIYDDQHDWLISEIINSGYQLPREKLPSCDGSLKSILFEVQKKR